MYSHTDIVRALKKRDLVITPFSARALKPNAVALHLDSKIAVPKKANIRPGKVRDYSAYYKCCLVGKAGYKLRPGAFILGRTKESVSISKKLGGMLDGSTTLARLGVTVTQTAMLIHTGHGVPRPRKIVLEIKNEGPFTITLTNGMHVAQLIIFELKTASDLLYDATGRYGKPENRDCLLPLPE